MEKSRQTASLIAHVLWFLQLRNMAAGMLTVELSVHLKCFIVLWGTEAQTPSHRRWISHVMYGLCQKPKAALRPSEIEFQLVPLVTASPNY